MIHDRFKITDSPYINAVTQIVSGVILTVSIVALAYFSVFTVYKDIRQGRLTGGDANDAIQSIGWTGVTVLITAGCSLKLVTDGIHSLMLEITQNA